MASDISAGDGPVSSLEGLAEKGLFVRPLFLVRRGFVRQAADGK